LYYDQATKRLAGKLSFTGMSLKLRRLVKGGAL
jgi:hypothetical protein